MIYRSQYQDLTSARLENVTQTIARILAGYDIRLRPNFGGKITWSKIATFVDLIKWEEGAQLIPYLFFSKRHFIAQND